MGVGVRRRSAGFRGEKEARLNGGQGPPGPRSGSQVEVGEVRDTGTCSGIGGQDLGGGARYERGWSRSEDGTADRTGECGWTGELRTLH